MMLAIEIAILIWYTTTGVFKSTLVPGRGTTAGIIARSYYKNVLFFHFKKKKNDFDAINMQTDSNRKHGMEVFIQWFECQLVEHSSIIVHCDVYCGWSCFCIPNTENSF